MGAVFKLDRCELQLVAVAGTNRVIHNIFNPSNYEHCVDSGDGSTWWQSNIQGCSGEFVVAKYLNMNWSVAEGLNVPDVGKSSGKNAKQVEVRTTHHKKGSLIIRNHDKDHLPYFLVIGQYDTFEIVGFMYGHEAKQEKWLSDKGTGGTLSYFVPRSAVADMMKNRQNKKTESVA
jgi:hypothetical protein